MMIIDQKLILILDCLKDFNMIMIDKIKTMVDISKHPADLYNDLITTDSNLIKAMAKELSLPYKNKRAFIRLIQEKIKNHNSINN